MYLFNIGNSPLTYGIVYSFCLLLKPFSFEFLFYIIFQLSYLFFCILFPYLRTLFNSLQKSGIFEKLFLPCVIHTLYRVKHTINNFIKAFFCFRDYIFIFLYLHLLFSHLLSSPEVIPAIYLMLHLQILEHILLIPIGILNNIIKVISDIF